MATAAFKKPRRDPVGWHSHEPTTALELTREKHEAEWDLFDESEQEWLALSPEEQQQRLRDGRRQARIDMIAIESGYRYTMRKYPRITARVNELWRLWSEGDETPEMRRERLKYNRLLDAKWKQIENEIRARLMARSIAAGVVATPAYSPVFSQEEKERVLVQYL